MNRPLRHDALLVWRETTAALAGWGDRALVLIGIALIVAAMRNASHGMAILPVGIAALAIGGWIGLGLGHVVEDRLVRHRDAYLFAEDVLTRAGAWRYRLAVMVATVVVIAGATATIDARATPAATAGLASGFLAAVVGGALMPPSGIVRSVAPKRWRSWVSAIIVAATAVLPLWWAAAPAWIVAVPVLVIAALTAPDDAEAVRFEAIVGRPVNATIGMLAPMVWWAIAVVVAAALVQGMTAGALGAAVATIAVWFGALRVLAWRWTGRRSGEMIVLTVVAASVVAGALAIVLAPIALTAATIWLWRRSRAATWLIV